ncbi:MAG: hypothetical protein HQL97_16525, partial [Magnetococcales bacterium]|nr:hypothetical protein [Magnetococcales bacterium]
AIFRAFCEKSRKRAVLCAVGRCRLLATTHGESLAEGESHPATWFFGPCSRDRFAKTAKRSRSQGCAQRFFAKGAKKRFFEERAKIKNKIKTLGEESPRLSLFFQR